jgi:hypothetical protein
MSEIPSESAICAKRNIDDEAFGLSNKDKHWQVNNNNNNNNNNQPNNRIIQ